MTKKSNKEEFIEKSIDKHGNKYDYSKTVYINGKTKIIIICPTHREFSQLPAEHIRKNASGCPKCKGKNKTTEEFIIEAIGVHGNTYDYSKSIYVKSNIKLTIICKVHGEFVMRPNDHLSSNQGCPKCKGKHKTTLDFIQEAISIHGNTYDYSKSVYSGAKMKLTIVCVTHGEFQQIPNAHLYGQGCPDCGIESRIIKQSSNYLQFVNKIIGVHGVKYNYYFVNYTNDHTNVELYCYNHGIFWQTPNSHLQGKGCPTCAKENNVKTLKDFIIDANSIWKNKYDYSKTTYINSNTKIEFRCKLHPELLLTQIPSGHLSGYEACSYCLEYRKTKEIKTLKFMRKELPDRDIIHNESTGNNCNDTGGHRFPDIRIDCMFYQIIIEVDEFKHRGADYNCDKKRMLEITSQLGIPCIFIRYNPDHKKSDLSELLKTTARFLNIDFENEKSHPWDDYGIELIYLFYD
jgi:hypothetical protein